MALILIVIAAIVNTRKCFSYFSFTFLKDHIFRLFFLQRDGSPKQSLHLSNLTAYWDQSKGLAEPEILFDGHLILLIYLVFWYLSLVRLLLQLCRFGSRAPSPLVRNSRISSAAAAATGGGCAAPPAQCPRWRAVATSSHLRARC